MPRVQSGCEAANWAADLSEKGIGQSAGMMVNYLYDIDEIVENHELYVREGKIAFQRGYWDKLSFLKLHGLPIE